MRVLQDKVPNLTTLFQVYATGSRDSPSRYRFSLLEFPNGNGMSVDNRYTLLLEEINPQKEAQDVTLMLTGSGFTSVDDKFNGHPWEYTHAQWNQWVSMYPVLDWDTIKVQKFQEREHNEWTWQPKSTDYVIDPKVAQFRKNMTPAILKLAATQSNSGWFAWVRKQSKHTPQSMEF